jgi:hypothetical protein
METTTIQLTPFYVEVDGVTVQVVEVSKRELHTGETTYIVSVKIIYKGIHTRVFPMFVKNTQELVNKLKVEITKIKMVEYSYGLEEVKRLMG